MAADEQNNEANEDAWKKSNRLLIIILAGVFGLILIGGGGAGLTYYLLADKISEKGKGKKSKSAKGKKQKAEKKPKVTEVKKPAKYFNIEPAFMVKVKSRREKSSFMKADVTIMTRSESVLNDLKQHEPLIKNDLLILFGNTKREDVITVKGKVRLQQKSLDTVNKILADQGNKGKAEAVLFTNFVVQ